MGKNESGKSNLLQLLSKVDLLNGISNSDLNKVNRKYSDKKPSIELKFKLDTEEKDKIKERLEPIVRENIKNNLWEKIYDILDLFSELYIANKDFEIVFGDLIERDDKVTEKLSILYKKFKINLRGTNHFKSFNNIEEYYDHKRIISERPQNGKVLNNILTDVYQILGLLNIDENLKIQFDNDLEERIKNIVMITENPVNKLDYICKKYNNKYEEIFNEENGLDFKKIDLQIVINLFESLDGSRLSFEEINKENIDNIIRKKMNSIDGQLEYTEFILKKEKVIEIDGAFKIYFKYEKKLKNSINNLCSFNQKIVNSIQSTQGTEVYNRYISSLKKLESNIFSTYKDFYKNKQKYSSVLNQKEIESYSDSFSYIQESIDFIYNFIPIFYLYEEKLLEDKYTYNDEFVQTFNSKNLIYLFFNIIGINIDDLRKIFNNQLSGEAQDLKNRIDKSIEENIEQDFNNFYKQEKIQISISFDGKCFALFIGSSNNIMNISERSRGLRWYLSMFIDMKANNLSDKKVIYLIDEPAVYLHPNAQKQVLEFFKSLTENQNQLIYATHSPYMIDSNELQKVRALQKVEGITKICNKIYNPELSKINELELSKIPEVETLSPILGAIGLDLKYNLGPNSNMLNIVTEGITDYMYISAMSNYLGIEGIYILPSVGASKVDHMACILIGWGVNFRVLLDYDNAGNEAAKKLEKLDLKINEDYYFLTGKDKFDREDENIVIEDLIDQQDINNMGLNNEEKKFVKAKLFKSMVENEKVILSEKTVRNFKQVFARLVNTEKEPIVEKNL